MKQSDHHGLLHLAQLVTGQTKHFIASPDNIKQLEYHGITALAAQQLSSVQSDHALSHLMPLMVANETLKSKALLELFQALEKAGFDHFLVFKGTALAHSVYPKPWLRPRTDTDILICKSDLDDFSRLFDALGYERQFAISGRLISYQCTFSKRLVAGASINIDVHWRINNRQCLANTFTLNELIGRANSATELAINVPTPSHADSLMIACLHRLGHHHTEERLAWLYDIHLLAQALTQSQWSEFSILTKEKQITALCLDGLLKSQRYFSTTIPNSVIKALETSAIKHEPSAIFLHRDLKAWRIFLSDLKALPSYQQRFHYVVETAVPNPSYIKQRMNTNSAFLGYIKRAINGFSKLFR